MNCAVVLRVGTLALLLAWQALAVANTTSFEAALATHLGAIQKRDWAAFESTLTAQGTLTFVLPNGRFTKTSSDFKKASQAWLADPDWSWSYQLLSASSNAHTGVAVLKVKYVDKNEAGVEYRLHYLLSLVFSQEQGGWKLIHDQNTLLPEE